ncbi:ABC-2 family transporter protein [Cohnella sp. CBP 2801]|uniref:ABC-2 family transporter protein n=2 Tax=Cohnella zeiphila TaxID=2761120 RepID=A0A7X0VT63_9BACL|nr:ABC-2 family transporter protein [Cohnella zeiphila]
MGDSSRTEAGKAVAIWGAGAAAFAKSAAVARITLRQMMFYKTDFLLRCAFLLMILYVFSQLWSAAYGGGETGSVAGFTLKQLLWYLVFTEALTLAAPPICSRIEQEVKNGDVAMRLVRPISYVLYHYASFLAEAALRFAIHLLAGSLVVWPIVGAPNFGYGWAALLSLSLGALTVTFLMAAAIGLCAFWIEETRGLEFVLQKLQFTLGGMLLPIDLMPDWLQRICAWLPFRAAMYLPARAAVHSGGDHLLRDLGVQAVWLAVLGAIVAVIFRRGAVKLHVNGG